MEKALLQGIAQRLQTAGVGFYSASDVYTPGVVGIFTMEAPHGFPESVALTSYPVSDPTGPDSVIGVQVMFRSADLDDLMDRVEAVFASLHNVWGVTLNGVKVIQILRRSGANLGADEAGIWARSENYYLDLYNPTANRI